MSDNIFIQASRLRLRFPSVQGLLTMEDLWQLPLRTDNPRKASIEEVGARLLTQQQHLAGRSILKSRNTNPENQRVDLAVEVVSYIADVLETEEDNRVASKARADEAARLDALIREREGRELPLDELKARRAALG